jgi:hypothetical protein
VARCKINPEFLLRRKQRLPEHRRLLLLLKKVGSLCNGVS